MTRSLLGLGALAMVLALAGCGGDDEPAATPTAPSTVDAQGRLVLTLTTGSAVTVPASGATGVISAATPVSLAFSAVECAPRLAGIGFTKAGKDVDLVARAGRQLCLVSLAVTNTGTRKNFFSSRIGPGVRFAALRTTDGSTYPVTARSYDVQAVADEQGQQLASTADLMQPGETRYDYSVYEIPAGKTADAVLYDPKAVS